MSGMFEPVETPVIKKLLEEVDVLVNVGANVGYYCCHGLAAGKKVVAFEPMPINLRYLLRNVQVNGWEKNFECFPMALSDHTGLVEIYGGGHGASLIQGWEGQKNATIVPVSTLDTALGDRFIGSQCLYIIDVEGVELAVLKGAGAHTGSATRPLWFIEISLDEHLPTGIKVNPFFVETFEMMVAQGYAVCTVHREPRLLDLAEIREVAASGHNTLGTHNFLFVDARLSKKYLELIRGCH